MKLTTVGEIIWQKEFSDYKDQVGAGLIIKPQGSIVSAGIYQFDVYIRGGRSGMISKDDYLDGCATGNLINKNATRETTYTGVSRSGIPAGIATARGIFFPYRNGRI
jgi:hypothetical protein